jgi:hypothetical protein
VVRVVVTQHSGRFLQWERQVAQLGRAVACTMERSVMDHHGTSRISTKGVVLPGRRRLAVLSSTLLLGGILFGSVAGSAEDTAPADAIRICGERDVLLEQFAAQHDETPRAFGLGSDGGVIEVLVSPHGGWTMLVTYPARPTCVIAVGEAWETLQVIGQAS